MSGDEIRLPGETGIQRPGRVPIGEKTEGAAGPVAEFLQGRFRYWRPKQAYTLRYHSEGQIKIGWGLLEDAKAALTELPPAWLIGLDPGLRLIEVKPAKNPREPGGLTVNTEDDEEWGTVWNRELVAWFKHHGVPLLPIEAQWQPQTRSIVGKWEPAKPQEAVTAVPLGREVASVKAVGHEWVLSENKSPTGKPLYRCLICGYYAADRYNPLLRERPCRAGMYDRKYEVKDGVVQPRLAVWGRGKDNARSAMGIERPEAPAEEGEEP